jgi:hypothetical protein
VQRRSSWVEVFRYAKIALRAAGTWEGSVSNQSSTQEILRHFSAEFLAGRYRISEVIDVSTFKGHDLALDRAVNVREIRAFQKEQHIWRQKARQLVLVQNPNLFNVIDIVCDESRDFVVSERPRGRSIAESLSELRPLCPDEVLDLMRPLAGALDLTALSRVCSTFVSASSAYAELKRTFAFPSRERSHRESPLSNQSPPFLLKLDAWEPANPRKATALTRIDPPALGKAEPLSRGIGRRFFFLEC